MTRGRRVWPWLVIAFGLAESVVIQVAHVTSAVPRAVVYVGIAALVPVALLVTSHLAFGHDPIPVATSWPARFAAAVPRAMVLAVLAANLVLAYAATMAVAAGRPALATGAVDGPLAWIVPVAIEGQIVAASAVLWRRAAAAAVAAGRPSAEVVGSERTVATARPGELPAAASSAPPPAGSTSLSNGRQAETAVVAELVAGHDPAAGPEALTAAVVAATGLARSTARRRIAAAQKATL